MKQFGSTNSDHFLKRIDWYFVFFIFVINFIGLICLYSATHGAHSTGLSQRFISQLVWLSAGWFLFFLVTLLDYKHLGRLSYLFYGLNLCALALIPFVGKSFYGAKRWLDLGFFRYQPSETMKIALILVLARILSKKNKPEGLDLTDLILPLAVTLVPFILIAKQPDLGTALMLMATTATLLLFTKVKKKIILIGLALSVITVAGSWKFALKDYQKSRVMTFLKPGSDPHGAGYNSIQSKIAVGSGQVFGKGFRKGTQSQLEFLPERHTDFIFSVLSEEFGLLGSVFTLIIFMLIFWRGLFFASVARDKFGVLIAIGGLSYLFWHMLVNICMVIGLMPIVGVPLPLMSYGGSSMMATMTSLGLVSSVAYRKNLF